VVGQLGDAEDLVHPQLQAPVDQCDRYGPGRLGDEVGYQIRFEKVVSKKTRIRFVTEGILLRQLLQDPELSGVAAILATILVVDKTWERLKPQKDTTKTV
jgi:hypothetical protein